MAVRLRLVFVLSLVEQGRKSNDKLGIGESNALHNYGEAISNKQVYE